MDDDPDDAANSKKRGRGSRSDGAHDTDPKRARVDGDGDDAAQASGANEEDAMPTRGRSNQEKKQRQQTLRNQRIVDAMNTCALRDDTDRRWASATRRRSSRCSRWAST